MRRAVDSMPRVVSNDFEAWHREIFFPVAPSGHKYYAGSFRQVDPKRPCLANDVFVPDAQGKRHCGAPHSEVLQRMNELCLWIRTQMGTLSSAGDQYLPIAVDTISCSVGSFIRIHPFLDGNGRTSRLLWGAILGALGLPPQFAAVIRPPPPYPEIMRAAMAGDDGPLYDAVILHLANAVPQSVSST